MLKVIQRDWQLYKHFLQLPPSPAPPSSTRKSQDSSAQNVTRWAGLSLLSQRHHHSLKGCKPCFPRILSRHGSGLEAANERNCETWKAKVKRKPYSRNALGHGGFPQSFLRLLSSGYWWPEAVVSQTPVWAPASPPPPVLPAQVMHDYFSNPPACKPSLP